MSQGSRRLEAPPIEALLRAVRLAHRTLPDDEFLALLATPDSPEEAAERREQIRWFLARYPTPAQRLAKARQSYEQWARTIPLAVRDEERRLRDEEAALPVRRPPGDPGEPGEG